MRKPKMLLRSFSLEFFDVGERPSDFMNGMKSTEFSWKEFGPVPKALVDRRMNREKFIEENFGQLRMQAASSVIFLKR